MTDGRTDGRTAGREGGRQFTACPSYNSALSLAVAHRAVQPRGNNGEYLIEITVERAARGTCGVLSASRSACLSLSPTLFLTLRARGVTRKHNGDDKQIGACTKSPLLCPLASRQRSPKICNLVCSGARRRLRLFLFFLRLPSLLFLPHIVPPGMRRCGVGTNRA